MIIKRHQNGNERDPNHYLVHTDLVCESRTYANRKYDAINVPFL